MKVMETGQSGGVGDHFVHFARAIVKITTRSSSERQRSMDKKHSNYPLK
jgi:hypothetical protein